MGRDGIFVESDRRPGDLAQHAKFFRHDELIGTAQVVRRGLVVRELTLYRGTYQTWPFPFDGRFRALAQRTKPSLLRLLSRPTKPSLVEAARSLDSGPAMTRLRVRSSTAQMPTDALD